MDRPEMSWVSVSPIPNPHEAPSSHVPAVSLSRCLVALLPPPPFSPQGQVSYFVILEGSFSFF